MLKRFNEIREELIDASSLFDGNLSVEQSDAFWWKTKRFYDTIAEIEVITKSLRTRGHTLAQCRSDLDTLIDAVVSERRNTSSAFYGCKLGSKCIVKDADIIQDPEFENVVVKIQCGREETLTADGKMR